MMEPEEIYYECEENDNYIKVITIGGKLDEIRIGCSWLPEEGESIIGADDLCKALSMARIAIIP